MSCSLSSDCTTFVTGACDATARLWDPRAGNHNQLTFYGHESDINTVEFFPNDHLFGTGSDDSSLRLYDIRSHSEFGIYAATEIMVGIAR